MGWDDAKTKLWFDTPNPFCGGITPRELWRRRPEKCERMIHGMIDEAMPPQKD